MRGPQQFSGGRGISPQLPFQMQDDDSWLLTGHVDLSVLRNSPCGGAEARSPPHPSSIPGSLVAIGEGGFSMIASEFWALTLSL